MNISQSEVYQEAINRYFADRPNLDYLNLDLGNRTEVSLKGKKFYCFEPGHSHEYHTSNKQRGAQHIHLGMVMIRIHALHRKEAGVKILLVIKDTRWRDARGILGMMEVDLAEGTGLVYFVPDQMFSISDFYNHIRIIIKTKGYEWIGGESNLLITRSIVARLTNTGYVAFRYNIQDITEYLASKGAKAIPGKSYSSEYINNNKHNYNNYKNSNNNNNSYNNINT